MKLIYKMKRYFLKDTSFADFEVSFKYHYLFLNFLLLFSSFLSFSVGVFYLFRDSYMMFTVSFSIFAVMLGLYSYLKKRKKRAFKLVSNLFLGTVFIFLTSVFIILNGNHSALLLFSLFVVGVFQIKGYKDSPKLLFLASFIFLTLYLMMSDSMNVGYTQMSIAFITYFSLALHMLFSELKFENSLKDIRKNVKKIDRQQNQLYKQARVMKLTNLPNRIAFMDDMQKHDGKISLLYLDIDNFDIISNEFGEKFADEILKEVAKKLKKVISKNKVFYHFYNNKFAILIKDPIKDEDTNLADDIKELFEKNIIRKDDISVLVSFRIAIVQNKNKTLSRALMIMRQMRQDGQMHYRVYKSNKKEEVTRKNNLYWAKRLDEIIKEDNLVVYFQPIVDNSDGKVVKYECLVRAIDKSVVVSPFVFLNVAKSKGILSEITKIVIDKSFQNFKDNSYEFSINITEDDIHDGYLVDYLYKKSKEYNIDPNRVFLEILENINHKSSSSANEQFKKIKELGFNIAIDDFGAELSNLSRLLTLEADILKIDGQFIKNLDSDPKSMIIVESIVLMAKKTGMKTVAEYVHNEEIYNIVKKLDIDFSQGYYFSPPLAQVTNESILEEVS